MTTVITGYQTTDLIYDGTRTLVYRGLKTEDSKPVVLKKLRKEYPTFNELLQFRHQYVLTKNLDLPGIVRPLALEKDGLGYVLVMEDVGGMSLSEYVSDRPLGIEEFLQVAIAITKILENLYRNRVIHKDIKPANILINPETKEIYLIDFSISSLLPRETQEIHNPNLLEGTLAYISPEQTGRMNRGIDYRSDFYSLGVTFYELLTGEVPFKSEDPMELVHCHIAKTPILPHLLKPEIPLVLSEIAMKLMAKTAENRYQSARGINRDLEKCWQQWQETGSIADFELGERDISERFLIPEKLYGREKEVQILLDAFNRVSQGNSELLLVAGYSGIGKTAVVNEVHKPIVRQRGYFIKGKFDQFNRNIPFSAFVIAFRDFMGQLLGESDAQLQEWKAKILEAVGENGQVLIDVIPELERIIGSQSSALELSGSAAQNRFNLLFEKFIAVFTTKEYPLTIFVDDLQWADLASLNLMKVLMGDTRTGYLLLLVAYRDNEVFPAHPLMLTLSELEKQQTTISTITLAPLPVGQIDRLVAETLSCTLELAAPLTNLVYQKTKGNPFFTTQFLKGLHEDGLITFNRDFGYWECDLVKVRDAALTDDVVEFMARRLYKLPEATQEVLKLAACIGNQFDLETLAIICQTPSEEVAAALWRALREGLILPQSEAYKFFASLEKEDGQAAEGIPVGYRFLHDRVQQAAYSSIPEEDKQITHLKIGQLLLHDVSSDRREVNLFKIANQLNYAVELVVEPEQGQELAQLNFDAALKAKGATAYEAAGQYIDIAINLLHNSCWQDNYLFFKNLYELATEIAFLQGDFEQMESFAEQVLHNAEDVIERVKIYEIKIQADAAQHQLEKSIQTGREILAQLGIHIRANPTEDDFLQEQRSLAERLTRHSIQELAILPSTSNSQIKASLDILTRISTPAGLLNPHLFALISVKQINLALEYGNTDTSPFAYACYGTILCVEGKETTEGYQFGQLALSLLETNPSPTIVAKTLFYCHLFITHWRDSLHDTLQPMLKAYQMSLSVGDLETATSSAQVYCAHAYFCGLPLDALVLEMETYSQVMEQLKQEHTLDSHQIYHQAVVNLLGNIENPSSLIGEIYQPQDNFENVFVFEADLHQLILCYLFNEYSQAVTLGEKTKANLHHMISLIYHPLVYFYDALAQLQLCHDSEEAIKESALAAIEGNREKLYKWGSEAPMNYLHKYQLVEAEVSRVRGQKLEAMEFYDGAIAGAKENEYIQEEALANELFAKFYLDWGREKEAAVYMQEAYYCYARWGAKAKTHALEKRYPQLLQPILQHDASSSSLKVSISKITSYSHSQTATIANISSILDFYSLLKASQILSGEIELDRLLSTLMKIILENAGATKGALLLTSETGLTVEAIATRSDVENELKLDSLHQSISLDDYPDLPAGLINYVRRTTETSLLDAKTAQTKFAADNYLLRFSPQSLLCLPLLERGNLIGILYLENSLTADAFTSDRVELLDALCAQAAISLNNARLYQQAQKALKDLQEAQLQLVQNEKMATLGNLVAGVAHEINNPVSFIGGNIDVAQKYLQDLLYGLELYQEKYPSPNSELTEKLEDLDLEFIAEDFPKLIASMQTGCDRIRHISTSLRTFSRKDKDNKTEFNLHDGLDSTLLILKYRLKANEERPAIEVVKNYGDIPAVKCYPGQLNQVFMNLLANAIDAFDEGNVGRTFSEIKAAPNRITITTEIEEEKQVAMVKIKDNGIGMSEFVKAKVFEHLFTTKGVGKGTGLGLSISRQIVEEKHGGKITLTSEVGEGTEFAIALPLT